jgi:hypothetical protein
MEDGFNGPLHVDHDHAAGSGTVAFGGDEFAVTVDCDGFPLVEESGSFVLRVFADTPDGEADEVQAEITRLVRPATESYSELLRVGHVVDSIPQGSATTNTDPAAEPIVRVLEDGRFSAIAEMQAVSERAPEGEAVFVGRCDW